MHATVLQPKNIADQVKSADLAATIREEFAASNCARFDLINVLGWLLLAENLGASLVGEFIQTDDWVRSTRQAKVPKRIGAGRPACGDVQHAPNSRTMKFNRS